MADGDIRSDDQNGATPGGLPLMNSGWGAGQWDFEPGEAFWAQIDKNTSGGAMAEQMDAAMAGKSAPRVWLIMHEPGQPELSAAVALAFARELGHRDQAALVLDCDDQSQTLTRWVERVEAEGWIDLARYGTSVLTAGVPMPFDGRRGYLLGVGSFAPTDITGEEIQQLVQRLRRQADDLILVAPADALGELWASVANIRLLCWDRASRTAADLEGLVTGLAATEYGLTGLVGFGLPKAIPTQNEVPEPVLDDLPEPEVTDPEIAEVDPVEPADDFEAPVAAAVAAEPEEIESKPEPELPKIEEADSSGWTDAPDVEDTVDSRKGTSGVFWFLASASVVIVAILGVYWFKYVRIPDSELNQPVAVVAQQNVAERTPVDAVQVELANHDDPAGDDLAEAVVDSVVLPAEITDAAVTEDAAPKTEDSGLNAAGPFEERTETEPEVQVADSAPAEPVFSMMPYRSTVGAAGWALHLYSFPDSSGADVELAELRRRGFETEIRVVEIPDKGRWWRIYVGSFASKGDARAATPLLLKKLRTDWAKPTRF